MTISNIDISPYFAAIMALEHAFVSKSSDKHVTGCVYDHFDWPFIWWGHQFGVIGYVSAGICWFKDMS